MQHTTCSIAGCTSEVRPGYDVCREHLFRKRHEETKEAPHAASTFAEYVAGGGLTYRPLSWRPKR